MKIVAISDTHDQHEKVTIPECDVLVVAGDFTCHREPQVKNYTAFNEWLGRQPAKNKIVVAGNHDTLFEQNPHLARSILTNAIYLEDSGVEIGGIKFWGSPWILPVDDWSFEVGDDEDFEGILEAVPKDTDILITHMAPYKILDALAINKRHVGSLNLLKRVIELSDNLKYHLFGHIHEGYGSQELFDVKFLNVAQCDEYNNLVNNPKEFHI